jgi:hypothetical protein
VQKKEINEQPKRKMNQKLNENIQPQNRDQERCSPQATNVPAADLPLPVVGDYVLATKYGDGDPQDHWCVGFYAGLTNPEKYDPPRHDVVDCEGKNFRGNGFRRIKKITPEQGTWMLKHAKDIELSGQSVWTAFDFGNKLNMETTIQPNKPAEGGSQHPLAAGT